MQETFRGASDEDTLLILFVLLILSNACHCQEFAATLIFCKFCMRTAEVAAGGEEGAPALPFSFPNNRISQGLEYRNRYRYRR